MRVPDSTEHSNPPKPVNLFFTGGYDSTFRLFWLALVEKRTVQTHYCLAIDTRQNTDIELSKQTEIRRELSQLADPILLPPHKIVSSIPRDEQIESSAFISVGRFGAGRQYSALARYALLNGLVVEVCINKLHPGYKWPYKPNKGFRQFIDPLLIGEGGECRVKPDCSDDFVRVFSNFRFPLMSTNKEEMYDLAHKHGFAWVLHKTFSCWAPTVDGKACGQCFNCGERFLK